MHLCKLLLVLMLVTSPAAAHDWYPPECCGGQDCAPVDKAEIIEDRISNDKIIVGGLMVTTKHGSVLVPPNFRRRESKDHRMHACMTPLGEGKMYLYCIFMPPST
jgi:hypothetical protein